MRRIPLDFRVQSIAQDYCKAMEAPDTFNQGSDPMTKLLQLSTRLMSTGTVMKILDQTGRGKYITRKSSLYDAPSKYVLAIRDHYTGLNALFPSMYHEGVGQYVDSILTPDEVSRIRVKLPKKNFKPLFELIVEAMRYDKVQSEILPKYIRQAGIKTCVYCNAQFATTALLQNIRLVKRKLAKIETREVSCYELDHNKPKSRYPYLCTNFYNLQPSCGSCNRRKNDRQLDFSLYYEREEEEKKPVHIVLDFEDIIRFRATNDGKGIKPHLCNAGEDIPPMIADKTSLVGKMNDMLNLQGIYDEHEDIVEEILWKHKIYSEGFMSATIKQIESLELKGFDMKRFILGGYYEQEEDFLKRPLSILKNDLWEQLNHTTECH